MKFKDKASLALSQFGLGFGASMASGVTIVVQFVQPGGIYAPFGIILALGILFTAFYLGVEISRKHSLNGYNELFKLVNGKASKVLSPIAEFSVFFTLAFSFTATISGFGSYLNQLFGTPIVVGSLILAALSILMTIAGLDKFFKIQASMGVLMIVILLCLHSYVLLGFGTEEILLKLQERWVPDDFSVFNMCKWSVIHASGAVVFISVFLLNVEKFKRRRDVVQTMGIGVVLFLVALLLPSLALIAFSPDVLKVNVPDLYLLTEIVKSPLCTVAYSILLIFAQLTTGIGCVVTINERLINNVPKMISNNLIRRIFWPLIAVAICVPVSLSGLKNFFATFSPIVSYLSLVVILLPLFIRAPVLLKKKKEGTQEI